MADRSLDELLKQTLPLTAALYVAPGGGLASVPALVMKNLSRPVETDISIAPFTVPRWPAIPADKRRLR